MLTKLMPNIYLCRLLGTVYFSVEKSTLPWLTAPPMSAGEWSLFSHEMLWDCGQSFQVAKSSFSTLSARSGSRLDLSKSEEQVFRSFSNIIFWFSKLLCDPVQKKCHQVEQKDAGTEMAPRPEGSSGGSEGPRAGLGSDPKARILLSGDIESNPGPPRR